MVRSLRWRGAMGLAMAFAAGVVLIGCAASGDADAELVRYAEARPLMGTSVRVLCYASSEAAGKAAAEAAFARATALIKVYSDYDRTSELSGLNISAGAPEGMRVSDDLLRVLTRAEYWHHKSDGAFDASVGPLVKVWRWARRNRRMPSDERLAVARAVSGFKNVLIDPERRTVRLTKEGMKLDLGGIAKGAIADAMIVTLEEHGITRALIDAGGDIVCADGPPGKEGWKVAMLPLPAVDKDVEAALARPEPRYVWVTHAAVATSGDAFQYVELDGKRFSHIVDPATGLGLTSQLGVSVIVRRSDAHPNPGTDADALASALNVLGPAKSIQLLDQLPETAALIMQRHGDGSMKVTESSHLDAIAPAIESE